MDYTVQAESRLQKTKEHHIIGIDVLDQFKPQIFQSCNDRLISIIAPTENLDHICWEVEGMSVIIVLGVKSWTLDRRIVKRVQSFEPASIEVNCFDRNGWQPTYYPEVNRRLSDERVAA